MTATGSVVIVVTGTGTGIVNVVIGNGIEIMTDIETVSVIMAVSVIETVITEVKDLVTVIASAIEMIGTMIVSVTTAVIGTGRGTKNGLRDLFHMSVIVRGSFGTASHLV